MIGLKWTQSLLYSLPSNVKDTYNDDLVNEKNFFSRVIRHDVVNLYNKILTKG